MGYTITVHYPKCEIGGCYIVICPCCNTRRSKVIKRSYYDNGFHTATDTKARLRKEVEEEAQRYEREGLICSKCIKAGKVPPENWTPPPPAPPKPKEIICVPTDYLSPSINQLWRASGPRHRSLADMTCPKTGEPLLQIPYYEGHVHDKPVLPLPESHIRRPWDTDEWVREHSSLIDIALPHEIEAAARRVFMSCYKRDASSYWFGFAQKIGKIFWETGRDTRVIALCLLWAAEQKKVGGCILK